MVSSKKRKNLELAGHDLISSNATTAQFVGNLHRSWMDDGDRTRNTPITDNSHKSPSSHSFIPARPDQRSEIIPSIGFQAQKKSDTTVSSSTPASLPSTDFDKGRYPPERHQTHNDEGIRRSSTTEGSEISNERPHHSHVDTEQLRWTHAADAGQDLHQRPKSDAEDGRTKVPPPSPIPSRENTEEGIVSSVIPSKIAFRTNPAIIDLTSSTTAPVEGLHAVLDLADQPLARAAQQVASVNTTMVGISTSTIVQESASPLMVAEAATNTDSAIGQTASSSTANTYGIPAQNRTKDIATTTNQSFRLPNQFQARIPSVRSGPATTAYDIKERYVCVSERLYHVCGQARCGNIEASRLSLLQQACIEKDYFFLTLHQMYCREHMYGPRSPEISAVTEAHRGLSHLLASNDDLTRDAMEWFSNFPSPTTDELQMEAKVTVFLESFAIKWTGLRLAHPRYTIPPTSYGILAKVPDADSVVLQQVIFRAILRTSWIEPQDKCFELCERFFITNQRQMRSYLEGGHSDVRSIATALTELHTLGAQELQKILAAHFTHSVDSQTRVNDSAYQPAQLASPPSRLDSTIPRVNHLHSGTSVNATGRTRPRLSSLEVYATNQSYPASTQKQMAPGLYSAPIPGTDRSSTVTRSGSLPTPVATDRPSVSRTSSAAQSPQIDTQFQQYSRLAGNLPSQHQQASQRTHYSQVFMPSGDPSMPNYARTPTSQDIRYGAPEYPEHWTPQPQQDPRDARQEQQIPQRQQLTQQAGHQTAQQAAQPQANVQDVQRAPVHVVTLQQNPQMQRNHHMQQDLQTQQGHSSNASSMPFTSMAPSIQGRYPQQMTQSINAHGLENPSQVQSYNRQQNLGLQQQANISFANLWPAMNYPAANVPVPPTLFNTDTFNAQSISQAGTGESPQAFNADPFIWNSSASLPKVPNPKVTALHQAHAKTPQLSYHDPKRNQENVQSFRYIKIVASHVAVSSDMPCASWDQEIDDVMFEKLPNDVAGPLGLPFRQVSNGAYLGRIRCIRLQSSDPVPSQSDWATANVCWPPYVTVFLNGTSLTIRRKLHYGQDLPIDVTAMLRKGKNHFSASVMGLPDESTDQYFVGFEVVEVLDAARIKNMLRPLTFPHCRDRILNRLRSANPDPDFEVIQSHIILNLEDPFSTRICDTPVRGINCLHDQCFDLDNFLETRGLANKVEPCKPEEFKCPICKGDVRPHMMIMDGFFSYLRAQLSVQSRLDAKEVILYKDGNWKVKEEEDVIGEEADGGLLKQSSPLLQSGGTRGKGKTEESTPIEMITLDDS